MTDQRSGQERRAAATRQPMPTGDGKPVIHAITERIGTFRALCSSQRVGDKELAESWTRLIKDLLARSEMGAEKYGTVLRTRNGRDARMDLYQELLDAAMYSEQLRMEGDKDASRFLEGILMMARTVGDFIHEKPKR